MPQKSQTTQILVGIHRGKEEFNKYPLPDPIWEREFKNQHLQSGSVKSMVTNFLAAVLQ